MTQWILVIVLTSVSGPGGTSKAIDHFEFTSEKSCNTAAKKLEKYYERGEKRAYKSWFECLEVPK